MIECHMLGKAKLHYSPSPNPLPTRKTILVFKKVTASVKG